MTERQVLDITPNPARMEAPKQQPFSAFVDKANLVLIGDPGAGKTHLFEEAAGLEGGVYIKARGFLIRPTFPPEVALFIDALDETRAGRADQNTIDSFVKKLFTIAPSKVRISCRAADWLGETDLAAFKLYFEGRGGVTVLSLQALSRSDQVAVLLAQRPHAGKASAADEFVSEAEDRRLQEFTCNPQNLLMLWDAVKGSGVWPSTRKELFDLSVDSLLKEFNRERQRSGVGAFQPNEIRDAAGALCAVRLVSNVAGISFQEAGDGLDFPSYRSLSFLDEQKSAAALSRRVFSSGDRAETVDYVHRTTAEFLGAEWIAKQVQQGLPIGRVLALIGVDRRPASELRGLYAWLTIFLPIHADRLIDGDPYGVLTYGDAAALSSNSRKHLLTALAKLSVEDPGFRSERRESPALGMLAQSDMVDEFRAILTSPAANFELRSIVIDALASGPPMPSLMADLVAVVGADGATYYERAGAVTALQNLGQKGVSELVSFTRSKPLRTENTLRLRDRIIALLGGQTICATDVVDLCVDTIRCKTKCSFSWLWQTAECTPLAEIPAVLNVFRPSPVNHYLPGRSSRHRSPNRSCVERTLEQLLLRYLRHADDLVVEDVQAWLRLRVRFKNSSSSSKEIASVLIGRPELTHSIATFFLDSLASQEGSFWIWHYLVELTLNTLNREKLVHWIIVRLPIIERKSPKQSLLLQIALSQCWSDPSWGTSSFQCLTAIAKSLPELLPVLQKNSRCDIQPWQQQAARERAQETRERDAGLAKVRSDFEENISAIRSGSHLRWLSWCGDVYFAHYDFVEMSAVPRERLNLVLGEPNATAAIEGLVKLVDRTDFLSPGEVASLELKGQRLPLWPALLAGLELAWHGQWQPQLDLFSDEMWRACLAIQLINPLFEREGNKIHQRNPEWRQVILEQRATLAQEAYRTVAEAYLTAGSDRIEGLHELLNEPMLSDFREDVVFDLLRKFPFAPPFQLGNMLQIAMAASNRSAELLDITRAALRSDESEGTGGQRDRWRVVGFLLSFDEFVESFGLRFESHCELIWLTRDLTGGYHGHAITVPLSVMQLEFLIGAFGGAFPNVPHPLSAQGNQNAWDAASYLKTLISQLSSIIDRSATEALSRLSKISAVETYAETLRHSQAQQLTRRRDAEYDRPNWHQTALGLSNGPPVNVGDLCALTLDHLETISIEIRSANTDPYKLFWNLDSYGRPRAKDTKPEEACRDALLTLLRPALDLKGIIAEPEGQMADDKRADIVVLASSAKVVIELKKDTHSELWSAAETQLVQLYARDPNAKGYGIYGVFWFGDKRKGRIPTAPKNIMNPQTSLEMRKSLQSLVPETLKNRISVIVFDVSAPSSG